MSTESDSDVPARLNCRPVFLSILTLKLTSLNLRQGQRKLGLVMRFIVAFVEELVMTGTWS